MFGQWNFKTYIIYRTIKGDSTCIFICIFHWPQNIYFTDYIMYMHAHVYTYRRTQTWAGTNKPHEFWAEAAQTFITRATATCPPAIRHWLQPAQATPTILKTPSPWRLQNHTGHPLYTLIFYRGYSRLLQVRITVLYKALWSLPKNRTNKRVCDYRAFFCELYWCSIPLACDFEVEFDLHGIGGRYLSFWFCSDCSPVWEHIGT